MKIESKFDKERKISNIITVVVAAFFMLALGYGVFYFNTPHERALRTIESGDRYFTNRDYRDAVDHYTEAYGIAPDDPEITELVHIKLMQLAEEAENADTELKRTIILDVLSAIPEDDAGLLDIKQKALSIDEDFDRAAKNEATIAEAKKLFDSGRYDDAMEKFDEALSNGAEESPMDPELSLARSYLDIRKYCSSSDWSGLAVYLDSPDCHMLREKLSELSQVDLSTERYLTVSNRMNCIVVIFGTFDENKDGAAAGVISSKNTFSVYEGEWEGAVPEGYGRVLIWNKKDEFNNASVMNGTLDSGIFTGDMEYRADNIKNVHFNVEKGSLGETGKDQKGNKYGPVSSDEYIPGVPCYGGSDEKLVLAKAEDTEETDTKKGKKKNSAKDTEDDEDQDEPDVFSLDVFDATVWPIKKTDFLFKGADVKANGTLNAGTPAKIVAEHGNYFYVRVGKKRGSVLKSDCLINLPEIMPDEIGYNITNAYNCIFRIHGTGIKDVTGETFYPDVRQDDNTFIVPLMFPVAKKLLLAETRMLEKGYTLKIYDTYRPSSVTKDIYEKTSAFIKENPKYGSYITDEGYKLTDFVDSSVSNHNYGTALDLTFTDIRNGQDARMQSEMHELSPLSCSKENNSEAEKLQAFMKDAGFTGAENEWWHFEIKEAMKEPGSFQIVPYNEKK